MAEGHDVELGRLLSTVEPGVLDALGASFEFEGPIDWGPIPRPTGVPGHDGTNLQVVVIFKADLKKVCDLTGALGPCAANNGIFFNHNKGNMGQQLLDAGVDAVGQAPYTFITSKQRDEEYQKLLVCLHAKMESTSTVFSEDAAGAVRVDSVEYGRQYEEFFKAGGAAVKEANRLGLCTSRKPASYFAQDFVFPDHLHAFMNQFWHMVQRMWINAAQVDDRLARRQLQDDGTSELPDYTHALGPAQQKVVEVMRAGSFKKVAAKLEGLKSADKAVQVQAAGKRIDGKAARKGLYAFGQWVAVQAHDDEDEYEELLRVQLMAELIVLRSLAALQCRSECSQEDAVAQQHLGYLLHSIGVLCNGTVSCNSLVLTHAIPAKLIQWSACFRFVCKETGAVRIAGPGTLGGCQSSECHHSLMKAWYACFTNRHFGAPVRVLQLETIRQDFGLINCPGANGESRGVAKKKRQEQPALTNQPTAKKQEAQKELCATCSCVILDSPPERSAEVGRRVAGLAVIGRYLGFNKSQCCAGCALALELIADVLVKGSWGVSARFSSIRQMAVDETQRSASAVADAQAHLRALEKEARELRALEAQREAAQAVAEAEAGVGGSGAVLQQADVAALRAGAAGEVPAEQAGGEEAEPEDGLEVDGQVVLPRVEAPVGLLSGGGRKGRSRGGRGGGGGAPAANQSIPPAPLSTSRKAAASTSPKHQPKQKKGRGGGRK
jgi:hypothetical protein